MLGLLTAEARASRLSFNDVIKRLAEAPEGSPTFVSKKVGGRTGWEGGQGGMQGLGGWGEARRAGGREEGKVVAGGRVR